MRTPDRRVQFAVALFLDSETDISVRQMAAAAGLSPSRFSHLFCQCFGMTPRKFIAIIRAYRSEHQMAREILAGLSSLRRTACSRAVIDSPTISHAVAAVPDCDLA